MNDDQTSAGESAGKAGGVSKSDVGVRQKSADWSERKLNGFYVTRDSIQAHPLWAPCLP